jgi:ribosomal protein L11 methyltransferase
VGPHFFEKHKPVIQQIWCWQRWVARGAQKGWVARLQAVGCLTWTATERRERARVLFAVYHEIKAPVDLLRKQFGGRVRLVKSSEWLKSHSARPTRIGKRLEIIHEKARGRSKSAGRQLHVPLGLAFGSGEHATTFLLLRELIRREDWNQSTVLDLGTGSGVLALAARLFGARRIVATDFDPDAVRTARQNEALNFPTALIRWRRGDVKELVPNVRYGLVLANLFSGVLEEAAEQITGSVAPGGELWLSGILAMQQDEVIAAYLRQGLRLIQVRRRGKWVMLMLRHDRL